MIIWRLGVYVDAEPETTRFSLSVEGEWWADAGRDGRTYLARPNSQARTGTGQKTFSLFSSPRAELLATLPSVDPSILS